MQRAEQIDRLTQCVPAADLAGFPSHRLSPDAELAAGRQYARCVLTGRGQFQPHVIVIGPERKKIGCRRPQQEDDRNQAPALERGEADPAVFFLVRILVPNPAN
jgi:hypothetical protein